MPVEHTIDTDKKLITTAWYGEATDGELIEALLKYQRELKSQPPYVLYDEILDLSGTTSFKLTATGLRRLSELAATTDTPGAKTRLAIVVTRTVAYGLARMYQTFRAFVPNSHKDVQVFKNSLDAQAWIGSDR